MISDNRKVFFDSPEEVKYWMNLIAATKKKQIFSKMSNCRSLVLFICYAVVTLLLKHSELPVFSDKMIEFSSVKSSIGMLHLKNNHLFVTHL